MADVLNRTTLQYLQSVNTPDYPVGDWVISPDLSAVAGVPQKYWKLTGDIVSEMTQPEKDAVDAAEAAAVLLTMAEASQAEEVSTTRDDYVTVLTLAPSNSFRSGSYRIDWSAALKRQSNRGKVRVRLVVDGSPAFEVQDLDPRGWVVQSGFSRETWIEDTHEVGLQIASSQAGRSVSANDVSVLVRRETDG